MADSAPPGLIGLEQGQSHAKTSGDKLTLASLTFGFYFLIC